MAGMNVNDIVEVSVLGTLFNQNIVSKFHYEVISTSTTLDPITASNTWAAGWLASVNSPMGAFINCCPPQYNANQIRVQIIKPTRWRAGQNNINVPGANAVATTSSNQSAVVTKTTAFSGRPFVGSLHIPGLAGGNILNGELTAAYKTIVGVLCTQIGKVFSDLIDGTTQGRPVIYHPRKAPAPVLPPSAIGLCIAQPTARTMRRRTVGVGN